MMGLSKTQRAILRKLQEGKRISLNTPREFAAITDLIAREYVKNTSIRYVLTELGRATDASEPINNA